MCNRGLLVTLDQSLRFKRLVKLAMGRKNLGSIDPNVFKERFPLVGKDVRILYLRVEPCLKGETIGMTLARLSKAGYMLEGTGELTGLLRDHPKEVEKWNWVFAARQKPWWQYSQEGKTRVTGASVVGNYIRFWRCFDPRIQYDGPCGILVSSPTI